MKPLYVLSLLVALASCNVLQPRDLYDEIIKQLEQLESIVKGEILLAHTDLENYEIQFASYSNGVNSQAIVSLQQEQGRINQQLLAVKNMAQAAGADISTCTNIREDVLNGLLPRYLEELASCVDNVKWNVGAIASDARYTIDVFYIKVGQLEWQIESCNRNILCLAPLQQEIQLSRVRLPQNIRAEKQAAQDLINGLRSSVDNCAKSKLSQYATEANSVLGEIVACVNEILG